MAKRIFKYLVYGIAWGWCWLVALLLFVDLFHIEPLRQIIFQHFSQNVLASTITGIGFGTSSVVYTFDHLRQWQKVSIHFGVGMGLYIPTALLFRWIPSDSLPIFLSFLLQSVVVFALIWYGFYLYHKMEANRINAQLDIQAKNGEENNGE